MKRILNILLLALCLTACKGEKTPVPSPEVPAFPEVKDYFINAGEYVEINFEANMDWIITIPTSQSAWFYIDDNGIKSYRVSGKASAVTVKICAVDMEEKYDLRTCVVTLSYGAESRDIATVSILPEERILAVYPGLYDSRGQYEFATEPVTDLNLTWPNGLANYILPVKIIANFDWSIESSHPEWMELDMTSSVEGESVIMIKGVPSAYPLDNQSGTLTFLDVKTGEAISRKAISIDGCRDIVRVDCNEDVIELNILGQYSNGSGSLSSEGCIAYLTATEGSEIIANAPWVKISGSELSSGNVINDKVFHISADRNFEAERTAELLAVPGYVLSGLDRNNLSAETVEKYRFARVHQSGVKPGENWGVITPVNDSYTMAVVGGGVYRLDALDPVYAELSQNLNTEEIYSVCFYDANSAEEIILNVSAEYESVSYISDYYQEEKTSDDNLAVKYPSESDKSTLMFDIWYFENGYHSVVVLRDKSGNAVAAIRLSLDYSFWPEVEYTDIRFVMEDSIVDGDDSMMPKNVVLEQLTSGSLYEQYKEYGIPVWRLVYKSADSAYNAMIYVPPFPADDSDSIDIEKGAEAWLSAESGCTTEKKIWLHVKMNDKSPELGKVSRIVLKTGDKPLFVLQCERQFI